MLTFNDDSKYKYKNPLLKILLSLSPFTVSDEMSYLTSPYLNTPHAYAKIVCLIVSITVSFAGYYCYTDSPWYYEQLYIRCREAQLYSEYSEDKVIKWSRLDGKVNFTMYADHCPPLMLERVFVFCNIVVLITSSICFIFCCKTDKYAINDVRSIDSIYHIGAAIIISIGCIAEIVNTHRISMNKCQPSQHAANNHVHNCNHYLLIIEKYASAGIGLASAIVYMCTACIIENVKLYGLDPPRGKFEPDASRQDVQNKGEGLASFGRKSRRSPSLRSQRSIVPGFDGRGSKGSTTSGIGDLQASQLPPLLPPLGKVKN